MSFPSLSEVQAQVWDSLSAAVEEQGQEWRTFSLATLDHERRPRVRTVVLRGVAREEGQLCFFTDPRTPKWEELSEASFAEALFWNSQTKEQLRCQCRASFHEGDELAARYQAQVPLNMAGDYAAEAVPGGQIGTPEEGCKLRENWSFGVVVLTVEGMDWLQLRGEGHRRAGFQRRKRGDWEMSWLQP